VPRFPQLRNARPVHRETRRGDIKYSLADISKAQRLLGYRPVWRVGPGLEKTVQWYVENLLPTEEKKVAHA